MVRQAWSAGTLAIHRPTIRGFIASHPSTRPFVGHELRIFNINSLKIKCLKVWIPLTPRLFIIHHLSLNLSLIGTFTWLMPPGPYRASTCRERQLTLDQVQYILFWPHKDMESLPGWVISSMRWPPPRHHKHERRYTPFTHPFILKRRVWKDVYDGQMIFGDFRA